LKRDSEIIPSTYDETGSENKFYETKKKKKNCFMGYLFCKKLTLNVNAE